jgi:hypothetical protein
MPAPAPETDSTTTHKGQKRRTVQGSLDSGLSRDNFWASGVEGVNGCHLNPPNPTPYTVHPKPYTLNPSLYSAHPTPFTLQPTPCTLHPALHTLHPTPHTLHPTPYTIHPTPYTLHPTPHTLHPTPYILHLGAAGVESVDGGRAHAARLSIVYYCQLKY